MTEKTLSIRLGKGLMILDEPKVMGIVNVTPDSFFSGSRTQNGGEIAARVRRMVEEGADILDVGGYSSRPGADEVSPEEEYSRLCRGLEVIRDSFPDLPVSVDTFRAEIAARCIDEWGVDIINDIGGGTLEDGMYAAVGERKAAYILMHTRGTPATMQRLTDYDDITADVLRDLAAKASCLHEAGVADVIIDPGFGFAKTVDQNFRLLSELEEFVSLGLPVLVGMSRKSMIWKSLGVTPDESLPGTLALHTAAMMKGAHIIRVHDVGPAVQTARMVSLLRRNSYKNRL